MTRLAVVAGGWHFPMHFYRMIAAEVLAKKCGGGGNTDLFVVAHRNPELPIVREEKAAVLATAEGPLADIDRMMYADAPTLAELAELRWQYEEAPNTVGDWGFFNQWLERHDFREYDVILNCHDDTYIRRFGVLRTDDVLDQCPWLLIANGRYPEAPAGYVRGSFEFWKRELLEMLGGRIDLGTVKLTREGKTDSPADFAALEPWNSTGVPLRDFLAVRGLEKRIAYRSQHYRVSRWAIEGERGFIHSNQGAPWSFAAGLEAYPV